MLITRDGVSRPLPRQPVAVVSFPSDHSYDDYKQATRAFVEWLKNASKPKYPLNIIDQEDSVALFDRLVNDVCYVRLWPPLSDTTISELPQAIAACETAIKLRERVSVFYATTDLKSSSSQGHMHFIDCLKKWHHQLQCLQISLAGSGGTSLKLTESGREYDRRPAITRIRSHEKPISDDIRHAGETSATVVGGNEQGEPNLFRALLDLLHEDFLGHESRALSAAESVTNETASSEGERNIRELLEVMYDDDVFKEDAAGLSTAGEAERKGEKRAASELTDGERNIQNLLEALYDDDFLCTKDG
jgi:hypothetical protein